MGNNISLTASMRSNLLSLQNISRQVSSTQNKLATGNKVNSAIDNPSSYYTARSLNNRANDLDALLDSMGQAVSTIKAATTALETGATFLEQAAAVVTSALETNTIPAKSYFEEKVGENGAVVTTAQELKGAIAAGKETIVVYGKIDYFENEYIKLQANQKLVGTEYYTGYTGQEKISQINFVSTIRNRETLLVLNAGSLISDLKVSANTTAINYGQNVIGHTGNQTATVNNIDISMEQSQYPYSGAACAALYSGLGATLNISGQNRIEGTGYYVSGTWSTSGGTINYLNGSVTNISLLETDKKSGAAVYTWNDSVTNIDIGAKVNIKSGNRDAVAILEDSTVNISGVLNVDQNGEGVPLKLWGYKSYGGNILNINSSAQLNLKTFNDYWLRFEKNVDGKVDKVNIASGAKINTFYEEQEQNFISTGFTKVHDHSDHEKIEIDEMETSGGFAKSSSKAEINWDNIVAEKPAQLGYDYDSSSYKEILNQYDSIIKDSSYKGVNLLKNEKLNVRFNENGSADLNVNGKDMSSNALGLSTVEWSNQGDIAQSLQEIANALKSIRAFTAELGNNYSIITNRQEFTENLINILTEGADKLTLADMNEESANMLSLQTRQQLAINSLSLASQASQSILKLF